MRILVFEIHAKLFMPHDAGQAFIRRLRTCGRLVDSTAPLPYLLPGLPPHPHHQELVEP
jgi:hypothetical protein